MTKKSTSNKVLTAMRIFLEREENTDGVSSKQMWKHLESIPAIKLEIYNSKNQRRDGILTGLTTRMRNGQILDIKVEKRNKHLFYIKKTAF